VAFTLPAERDVEFRNGLAAFSKRTTDLTPLSLAETAAKSPAAPAPMTSNSIYKYVIN
jgi:hypothetical protein